MGEFFHQNILNYIWNSGVGGKTCFRQFQQEDPNPIPLWEDQQFKKKDTVNLV